MCKFILSCMLVTRLPYIFGKIIPCIQLGSSQAFLKLPAFVVVGGPGAWIALSCIFRLVFECCIATNLLVHALASLCTSALFSLHRLALACIYQVMMHVGSLKSRRKA